MSKTPPLAHLSTPMRVLTLVGIILLSVGVLSVTAMLLLKPLFGLDIIQNPGVISNYEDKLVVSALKFLQTIQAIGIFIIPPIVLALLVSSAPSKYLKLNTKPFIISSLIVVFIMFAAMPVINWMAEINGNLKLPGFLAGVEEWMRESEENAAKITKVFLKMESTGALFFNLFMIALLPATGEELLFRGVLQKLFVKWFNNVHVGIFITAALFSAMHMQFFGFFPRMMLGVLFGYMVVWSGSLWLPIIGHFVNNGTAVILSYMIDKKVISDEIETAGADPSSFVLVLFSGLILSGLLYSFYKFEKSKVSANAGLNET